MTSTGRPNPRCSRRCTVPAPPADAGAPHPVRLRTYRDPPTSPPGPRSPLATTTTASPATPARRRTAVGGQPDLRRGARVGRRRGRPPISTPATTRARPGHLRRDRGSNPFFIAEVLRHLIESGGVLVRRVSAGWWPTPSTSPSLRASATRSGRRLSRLSDVANEVLTIAAVMGRDFRHRRPGRARGNQACAARCPGRGRPRPPGRGDRRRHEYRFHPRPRVCGPRCTRSSPPHDDARCTHRRVADAIEKLRPQRRAKRWPTTAPREVPMAATSAGRSVTPWPRPKRPWRPAPSADAEVGSPLRTGPPRGRRGPDAAERIAALCGLGESQRDQGDPGFRETLLEHGTAGGSRRATAPPPHGRRSPTAGGT